MDAKGRTPPAAMITKGSAYQTFSGIGRGIGFTRQGKSGLDPQFLPTMAPSNVSGKHRKSQIASIASYTFIGDDLLVHHIDAQVRKSKENTYHDRERNSAGTRVVNGNAIDVASNKDQRTRPDACSQ